MLPAQITITIPNPDINPANSAAASVPISNHVDGDGKVYDLAAR